MKPGDLVKVVAGTTVEWSGRIARIKRPIESVTGAVWQLDGFDDWSNSFFLESWLEPAELVHGMRVRLDVPEVRPTWMGACWWEALSAARGQTTHFNDDGTKTLYHIKYESMNMSFYLAGHLYETTALGWQIPIDWLTPVYDDQAASQTYTVSESSESKLLATQAQITELEKRLALTQEDVRRLGEALKPWCAKAVNLVPAEQFATEVTYPTARDVKDIRLSPFFSAVYLRPLPSFWSKVQASWRGVDWCRVAIVAVFVCLVSVSSVCYYQDWAYRESVRALDAKPPVRKIWR